VRVAGAVASGSREAGARAGYRGDGADGGLATDKSGSVGGSGSTGSGHKRSSTSVPAGANRIIASSKSAVAGSRTSSTRGSRAVVAWGSPTAGATHAVKWAWEGSSPNSTGGSTGGGGGGCNSNGVADAQVAAAAAALAPSAAAAAAFGPRGNSGGAVGISFAPNVAPAYASRNLDTHSVCTPDAAAGLGRPGGTSGNGNALHGDPGRGVTAGGIMIVGTLDVEVEEWIRYVASLDLLRLPEQAASLPLLGEALAGAPVHAPWLLCRGPSGELFFANETTRCSSFMHPFHVSLQKLARVCRTLLALPKAPRRTLIAALREAWEKEANKEFGMWCAAADELGQEYFYHADSMAVMWEHPRDIVWNAYCMKVAALEQLEDDGYVMRVLSDTRADVRGSAAKVCQRMGDVASASHAEAVADLLVDECEWIRAAAAEALLELGETGKSAPSTTTSWFSATSRVMIPQPLLALADGCSWAPGRWAKAPDMPERTPHRRRGSAFVGWGGSGREPTSSRRHARPPNVSGCRAHRRRRLRSSDPACVGARGGAC